MRICNKCQGTGHTSDECTVDPNEPKKMECYKCHGKNHLGRDCPSLKMDICFNCGCRGHHHLDCPFSTKRKNPPSLNPLQPFHHVFVDPDGEIRTVPTKQLLAQSVSGDIAFPALIPKFPINTREFKSGVQSVTSQQQIITPTLSAFKNEKSALLSESSKLNASLPSFPEPSETYEFTQLSAQQIDSSVQSVFDTTRTLDPALPAENLDLKLSESLEAEFPPPSASETVNETTVSEAPVNRSNSTQGSDVVSSEGSSAPIAFTPHSVDISDIFVPASQVSEEEKQLLYHLKSQRYLPKQWKGKGGQRGGSHARRGGAERNVKNANITSTVAVQKKEQQQHSQAQAVVPPVEQAYPLSATQSTQPIFDHPPAPVADTTRAYRSPSDLNSATQKTATEQPASRYLAQPDGLPKFGPLDNSAYQLQSNSTSPAFANTPPSVSSADASSQQPSVLQTPSGAAFALPMTSSLSSLPNASSSPSSAPTQFASSQLPLQLSLQNSQQQLAPLLQPLQQTFSPSTQQQQQFSQLQQAQQYSGAQIQTPSALYSLTPSQLLSLQAPFLASAPGYLQNYTFSPFSLSFLLPQQSPFIPSQQLPQQPLGMSSKEAEKPGSATIEEVASSLSKVGIGTNTGSYQEPSPQSNTYAAQTEAEASPATYQAASGTPFYTAAYSSVPSVQVDFIAQPLLSAPSPVPFTSNISLPLSSS
ncbi:uncharacterized protein MONOS_4630 [Monocercomonoides exilis]|uniref:uncharacterized protein n=1 Tax=Monocercomonoides exilis TaxID=2049356 RepID=UPI003559FACC|nr:hypothetical protein MONOS_4630 [Monocercomonoides exilis]|eukprot:MONOS_4630.1-p1 / transcript=MONOS_4630.1 / gene=MONOS_4630 / organism=Monocercomonoides_exilis_PA203 / gene_product=unspecified product / transcript_product=unspecified product / location=Mono_scaffold00125:38095-40378(+) / protein_length=702 / sequence_SO=supercontig / SO=protein_coding / is_pseudo=false